MRVLRRTHRHVIGRCGISRRSWTKKSALTCTFVSAREL